MAKYQLNAPQSQFYTWIAYTIAAPIGVFVISWPMANVMDLPHPFLSTFGTSDVVPLAALILFGVVADVEHDAIFSNQRSRALLIFKHLSSLFAILALAGYGALKGKALLLLGKEPLDSVAENRLSYLSAFSIVILMTSILFAIYTKSLLMSDQVTSLAQGERP